MKYLGKIILPTCILVVISFIVVNQYYCNTTTSFNTENSLYFRNKSNVTPSLVLKNLDANNYVNLFPRKFILDSVNFQDPIIIETWLDALNKHSNVPKDNIKLMYDLLGKNLETRKAKYFNSSDSLLGILIWTESLIHYQVKNPENKILFKVLSNFWLSRTAKSLSEIATSEPKEKYKFKFRYLVQRLSEKKYLPNISFTKAEKVLNELLNSRFSYVMSRTISDTSTTILSIIIFLIVLTIITYVVSLKYLCEWLNRGSKNRLPTKLN